MLVISLVSSSKFTIRLSSPKLNRAAIFVDGVNSSVTINQSSFINNVAGSSGGGVYISGSSSHVFVHQSSFINNEVGTSGGGFFTSAICSFFSISQSRFISNTAREFDERV